MNKVIKHLKENWIRHGFETLVVVVGILVAYNLNNWNENLKEAKKEREILTNIKKNCQSNIDLIQNGLESHQRNIYASDIVLDVVRNKKPFFDSLVYHFHNAVILPDHNLSFTAYESLKSTGFNIISNKDLKNEIIDLFDVTYPKMIGSLDIVQRNRLDLTIPYYAEHFERDSIAIPNNYDELLANQQYINMIVWIKSLHNWAIYLKRPCLEESERIIKLIDHELDKE